MPGVISTINIKDGQEVQAGDVLLSIEAMKMETTVTANTEGTVAKIQLTGNSLVDSEDLVLVLK